MYSFSDLAKIIFVEIKKIWFAPQIFFDVEKLGVFGELCTMDRLLLHMSQFCCWSVVLFDYNNSIQQYYNIQYKIFLNYEIIMTGKRV